MRYLQHRCAGIERVNDVVKGHGAQATGCHLDRQWESIELGKHRVEPLAFDAAGVPILPCGAGSLGEQDKCRRRVERRDLVDPLTTHSQPRAARRKDPHNPIRHRQQPFDQFGGAVDNVLAVIEHDESVEPCDGRHGGPGLSGVQRDRKREGDRRENANSRLQSTQVNEVATVYAGDQRFAEHRPSERCLARAARPQQRHERLSAERRRNSRIVVVAPDEADRNSKLGRSGVGEPRDETITPAASIANGVLRRTVVADGPSRLLDPRRQVRFREKPVTPHTIKEIGLRQHTIPMLYEDNQQIERLRFEMHCNTGASNLTTRRIDLNVVEPKHNRSLAAGKKVENQQSYAVRRST